MRLHAVILAGGRGERFWPLSRRSRPKQFLPLLDDRSMLTHTLERVRDVVDPRDIWIITARDLKREAESLAPEVSPAQVIGEPMGKNTAPAIALAAWWIQDASSDSVITVLPSDHRIEPQERFREELTRAAKAALDLSVIVTFGVPPTRPETGYGYIESGDPVEPGSVLRKVAAFREKPDPETAARYVSDGRHLWNAGMFVFPPRTMLEEIRAHAPEIAAALASVPRNAKDGIGNALEGFYRRAPSISIDYAVMERSKRAIVARAGFFWDDLGSWAAIGTRGSRDPLGNVVRGLAILHDCKGVITFAETGLVAGVGVEDLVIVRTPDVTLVCRRDRAQDVRAIVEQLKTREELDGYL
jgi:mannose-1-phosphate guanylyltransferase